MCLLPQSVMSRGTGRIQRMSAVEFSYWLRTHGLQCFVMTMRDEAPEVFAAGFTDEAPDARGWIPEPPDDDGWFLGSVHDTDDGPVCYWFRHTRTA